MRKLRREPASVLVADVHRSRRFAVEEQTALRLEVLLHVRVKVEMLVTEIREDEHGEAHAVEPVQRRRVR